MSNLFEVAIINAVVVTLLAVVVWAISRVWRQPAFVHALWVLVLVKLLTPPLFSIPWPQVGFISTERMPSSSNMSSLSMPRVDADALNVETLTSEMVYPDAVGSTISQPSAPVERVAEGEELSVPTDSIATNSPAAIAEEVAGPPAAPDDVTPARSWGVELAELWAQLAVGVWLAGSAAWLAVTVMRLARFHRALRETSPPPAELNAWAREVSARLGVSPTWQLRVTEARLSPLVWPIGRATIVLPRRLLSTLSRDEIEMLLAHELAHLRRKDHWVRWLELAATTIYWWLPAVWWTRSRIHQAEERACDACVVGAYPRSANRYASALFKAVECVMANGRPTPLVASQLSAGRDLKERIENIMNATWTDRLSTSARLAVLLAGLVILPLSLRAAQQQDDQPQAPADEAAAAPEQATADDSVARDATASTDFKTRNAWFKVMQDRRGAALRYEPAAKGAQTGDDSVAQTPRFKVFAQDQDARLYAKATDESDASQIVKPGTVLRFSYTTPAGTQESVTATVDDESSVTLIGNDGDTFGRLHVANLTVAQAEAAIVKKMQTSGHDLRRAIAARVAEQSDTTQIAPGMRLFLDVEGELPEGQIQPVVVVDRQGYIDLAVPHGRVYSRMKVDGLMTARVSTDVTHSLREFNPNAKARVMIVPPRDGATIFASAPQQPQRVAVPADPYKIAPGDVLFVWLKGTNTDATLRDNFVVEPGGAVALGPEYGRVKIAGLTLEEAEGAITDTLQKKGLKFAASVTVGGWQSKAQPSAGPTAPKLTAQRLWTAAPGAGAPANDPLVARAAREKVASDAGGQASDSAAMKRNVDVADVLMSQMSQGSGESLSVLKRMVQLRQRDLERMEQIVSKTPGAISAGELESKRAELEISMARVKQAERGLESRRLLVELAQAKYEAAAEANSKTPGAVSPAELRQLQILIELAKSQLRELAE